MQRDVNIKESGEYYIATDGISIFHEIDNLQKGQVISTGQPYIIKAADKDAIMRKIFSDIKIEDGEYNTKDMTRKPIKNIQDADIDTPAKATR